MNNSTPKVSILMAAYNAEKYIEQSIESILKQSFQEFEFIIIDDCSVDSTWQILQNYTGGNNSKIKISRNTHNLGVSKTRNKLIRQAKGEYLAWQDADDISAPNRIQDQYEYFTDHPKVVILGSCIQFIDESGTLLDVRKYAEFDKNLRKNIFKYSPVSQPVAMIRKSSLMKTELFDEGLLQAEDLDLSFKLGQYGEFANIQDILLYYRYHPLSLSAKKLRENIQATLNVRRKALIKYGYTMSLLDHMAFVATWFVQFIPSAVTQKVFPFFRSFFTTTQ